MHGSGLSHIVWSLHEQFYITNGYNVLSVDLPGHGNSDGPAIKSIEKISDWVSDLIINLKLNKINFVGHSQGCLVGIDFAFSYPFIDFKSYFPDCKTINPNTVFQLWECIEKQNQGQEDLYGGGIWDDKILGEYYNSPVKRGKLYSSRRRLTEIHAKKIRSPSCAPTLSMTFSTTSAGKNFMIGDCSPSIPASTLFTLM